MGDSSETQPRKRPSGRRSGDSGTRDAILDAARDLFATRGYDGASVRAIASQAGVDSALIRHFFGDKQMLFVTTMADRTMIPRRMVAALSGPTDMLGHRVVDTYLSLWEDDETRPILLGLVRSAMTSDHGIEMLLESIGGRLRETMPLPFLEVLPPARLALAASQMLGVAIARHVLLVPQLADRPHDDLVAELGPLIQQCLTGEAASSSSATTTPVE